MTITLVLDSGYQPINMVPFSKALSYVVKGKVDVLASYDISVHSRWKMPAVVRLTRLLHRRKHWVKFSRQNVFLRDRCRCQYCSQKKIPSELTFDHVIPRSRGGKTSWQNIVTACIACNRKKGNRTPEEAGMRLRTKPVRPFWLPIINTNLHNITSIPVEWRDYWTIELEA